MTNSLLITSPSAVSSPAPKFVRDPIIRPGTKFLFDLTDPRCHPGGEITTGDALGKTFVDLVSGVTAAVNSGAQITVGADGGLVFSGNGETSRVLRIGSAGQFDIAPTEYESLTLLTMRVPASGYTTDNFKSPMQLTQSGGTSAAQVWLDMGTGGLLPRAVLGTGASSVTAFHNTNITAGAVFQFGAHFVPGVSLTLIVNGAASMVLTSGVPSALQAAATAYFQLVNNLKFTAYRFSHHDITESVSEETAQGLTESERLTAAQMALADWQFTSGTLTGAPRDAIS